MDLGRGRISGVQFEMLNLKCIWDIQVVILEGTRVSENDELE